MSTSGSKTLVLLKTGRLFFAIALGTFAVEHFIWHDFLIGRAPAWPEQMPGKLAMAYTSGIIMLVCVMTIFIERKARITLIVLAVMIFTWAVLRHLPVVSAVNFSWGGELTNLGKALTLFGGTLAVAGSMPEEKTSYGKNLINQTHVFFLIGRICFGVFMIVAGIEHFVFEQFVMTLVPAWIPGKIFWTDFAGIALIAGGVGLLIGRTVRLAGILTGIMIFIWFAILHIPRAVAFDNSNEWIAVAESLCFSGIAFVLAGSHKKR